MGGEKYEIPHVALQYPFWKVNSNEISQSCFAIAVLIVVYRMYISSLHLEFKQILKAHDIVGAKTSRLWDKLYTCGFY